MVTKPPEQAEAVAQGRLTGQTVVVTGDMQRWTREEIEELIREHGGRATSTVSHKTTLLVAGPGAGSKLVKALEYGVKIVNEDQFAKIIDYPGVK